MTPGGRRGALAALFVFLVAFSARPGRAQDLPKPGERWSLTTNGDLTVLGQASARRVEEIARGLALARAALLATVGAPDHRAPYPTTVYLFRDDATLLAYHRQADGSLPTQSVLSALDRQGRVLALSLEALDRDLPQAREALAGDLIDQLLIAPPPWLRTGLAGWISRLEPTGGATSNRLFERMTAPPPAVAAGEPAPVRPTTSTAWPAAQTLRAARRGEQRDVAVGLVRHLAHPRSERSSQLRRYLTLLRGGMPSDVAFQECFFESFEEVYADVAAVAARGGAPAIELEAAAPPPAPAREAAYDDVVLALGDLLVRAVSWNTIAAELHFRAVLEHRPDDVAALRGVALVREADDRAKDAAELWDRVLAAAPADRTTPMLYGWSRLERFRHAVGTRRGWEDPLPVEVMAARDLFLRAMTDAARPPSTAAPKAEPEHEHHEPAAESAQAPGGAPGHREHDLGPPIAADASPHALHGWAATFLYAREAYEPALAALERATRLLPGDDQIAADFAVLQAHSGNHNLAWDLRRQRLLGRVAPELDAEVEKLLVEESLQAADRYLLVEQKPDSALGLVRRALEEARDAGTRQEIERLLGQMSQVQGELARGALLDRFTTAYDEAKGLASQRRFDDARALLRPFAADDVDPMVRDPARDLLRQLDQVDPPAPSAAPNG